MRILIACGGTAGHIFPGLALAEELTREKNLHQVVIVVSAHPRDREYLAARSALLKEVGIETIDPAPLPYSSSPKYVYFAARLLWAFLKSFIIILRYRPAVAVGFGGYASFAPVVIAHIMRIPTLIHEQNLVPGRANQLLAKIVDRIAISFGDTSEFFSGDAKSRHRIVKTGFLLRRQILDYKSNYISDRLRATPGKFTIVVLGGSQGADNINELALNCLDLMDEEKLSHLQLIHLTGKRQLRHVQARYESLHVEFQVFDFLEDIASVYRNADLLISRAGAGTIFEAANFGLPCVLIPYPYGTKHQIENALFLQHTASAIVLNGQAASAKELKKILLELIANKGMRQELSQRIRMLAVPAATFNLKEQVLILHRGR